MFQIPKDEDFFTSAEVSIQLPIDGCKTEKDNEDEVNLRTDYGGGRMLHTNNHDEVENSTTETEIKAKKKVKVIKVSELQLRKDLTLEKDEIDQ